MRRRFIIYGLLGFCAEVLWTGFLSMLEGDVKLTGSTYIWMFLIYGLAVLFEPVHNRIRHLSIFLRGGVYMVLIYFLELICGLLLREILGVCPWNYGDEPLSINGIITLRYIPVWFTLGLIFEKIHDTLLMVESGLKRI